MTSDVPTAVLLKIRMGCHTMLTDKVLPHILKEHNAFFLSLKKTFSICFGMITMHTQFWFANLKEKTSLRRPLHKQNDDNHRL